MAIMTLQLTKGPTHMAEGGQVARDRSLFLEQLIWHWRTLHETYRMVLNQYYIPKAAIKIHFSFSQTTILILKRKSW